MSVIDSFLQRYAKEYDFYNELAHQVATICETIIQRSGIRAIVTYRAKKPDSLKEKLIKRNSQKKYQNIDQIYRDIVDLSGVRIAIYFPGDREEIGRLVESEFITEKVKRFPDIEQLHHTDNPFKRRFTGYDAIHYRVRIKEEKLEENNKRFAHAQVEIQIASALMHSWAEVEHDLAYKPQIGRLSEEEFEILDELNGLVLSGEIALERLQKAFKHRIATIEQQFNNHYELAALIREKIDHELLKEFFMGRVDVLLRFLHKVELDNPQKICKYLNKLKNISKNKSYKTIADYFADMVLYDYPEFYRQYIEAKHESDYSNPYLSIQKQVVLDKENKQLGYFVDRWVALVKTVEALTSGKTRQAESTKDTVAREYVYYTVKKYITDDESVLNEVKHVEDTRNNLVYGSENPGVNTLKGSAESIIKLIRKLTAAASEEQRLFIESELEKLQP
ncbi:MAG: GTP pyrophosphokinase [Caulobacteraceae bacterium]